MGGEKRTNGLGRNGDYWRLGGQGPGLGGLHFWCSAHLPGRVSFLLQHETDLHVDSCSWMFPVVFWGHWISMPGPLFWKYERSHLLFSCRSILCLYSTVDRGCSRLSKSFLHGSSTLTTSSLEYGSPGFVQIGYLQDSSQSKVYRCGTMWDW